MSYKDNDSLIYNREMNQSFKINKNILSISLRNAIYYAFLSLPFTNANISSGAAGTGLKIKNRIENIIKGKLAEDIIIYYLNSKNLKFEISQSLKPHPEKTAYWLKDECDAIRINSKNEVISDVDIKTLNFNWKLDHAPTLNDLKNIKLKRSKQRAPLSAKEIKFPFGILLEEPWRHFHKLSTQRSSKRSKNPLNRPIEVLFAICSQIRLKKLEINKFETLYSEYYDYWQNNSDSNKKNGYLQFPGHLDIQKIPKSLQSFILKPQTYPESLHWVINNWVKIEKILDNTINQIENELKGYWIWISGFANQNSTQYFNSVYQNDAIYFNQTKIWSSATRSPHEKKWYNFINGKRKSRPEIDDNHPELYLNNHVINVNTNGVYSIKKYLK